MIARPDARVWCYYQIQTFWILHLSLSGIVAKSRRGSGVVAGFRRSDAGLICFSDSSNVNLAWLSDSKYLNLTVIKVHNNVNLTLSIVIAIIIYIV